MSFYLVSATPRRDLMPELHDRLVADEFRPLRPFGNVLTGSLRDARRTPEGGAVWEEEDYCRPPLAEERAAVLDAYFDDLKVEPVQRDEGWRRIADLPPLFPDLAGREEKTHG
jgi:hypothetical protein